MAGLRRGGPSRGLAEVPLWKKKVTFPIGRGVDVAIDNPSLSCISDGPGVASQSPPAKAEKIGLQLQLAAHAHFLAAASTQRVSTASGREQPQYDHPYLLVLGPRAWRL